MDNYEILGLNKYASMDEIDRKYHKLLRDYHPLFHTKENEEEKRKLKNKFNEINVAYNKIKNERQSQLSFSSIEEEKEYYLNCIESIKSEIDYLNNLLTNISEAELKNKLDKIITITLRRLNIILNAVEKMKIGNLLKKNVVDFMNNRIALFQDMLTKGKKVDYNKFLELINFDGVTNVDENLQRELELYLQDLFFLSELYYENYYLLNIQEKIRLKKEQIIELQEKINGLAMKDNQKKFLISDIFFRG